MDIIITKPVEDELKRIAAIQKQINSLQEVINEKLNLIVTAMLPVDEPVPADPE